MPAGRHGELTPPGPQEQVKPVPATRREGGRSTGRTTEGLMLLASLPADYVALPGPSGAGLVESGAGILFGGQVVNVGTAAATVTIYDGTGVNGNVVAVVIVPANSSAPLNIPNRGVLLEQGAFTTVAGPNVTGVLYIGHLWRYPFTPPGE